jgi:hypothetical protein
LHALVAFATGVLLPALAKSAAQEGEKRKLTDSESHSPKNKQKVSTDRPWEWIQIFCFCLLRATGWTARARCSEAAPS